MQPLDQLFGQGLFLPGPVLYTQEGVPVVAHLGDIPLPARDLRPLVGNHPLGFLQCEAVALDEDREVRCTHTSARMWSTKARAASICIRPLAIAGVKMYFGVQEVMSSSSQFLIFRAFIGAINGDMISMISEQVPKDGSLPLYVSCSGRRGD
jgi:hypothetical protein